MQKLEQLGLNPTQPTFSSGTTQDATETINVCVADGF